MQTPTELITIADHEPLTGRASDRRIGFARVLQRRGRIAEGAAPSAFIGLCSYMIGLNGLVHSGFTEDLVIAPALVGAACALTPARSVLRSLAALALATVLIIGYTPLIDMLAPKLARSDVLRPVPAVVVLSTYLFKDNHVNGTGQERALQAYLLLRAGYSHRLVLTRAIPKIGDEGPAIREQMRALGLDYAVDEVGPVADTHDEALVVAALARRRGWDQVILVTQPWHMARASAVFEKAGLHVLCSPCVEGGYDISDLSAPGSRLLAFRDWLHETIGLGVYRMRGWL